MENDLEQKLLRLSIETHERLIAQGIPPEEITDDGLWPYVRAHLTQDELFELVGVSREQYAKDLEFALFCNVLEDLAAEGHPVTQTNDLGIDDPVRVARIRDLQRWLRERDSEEAYWDEDEDEEEGGDRRA
jgi:hypothetical protein